MLWILGFHPKDLRPFRSGDIDFPICEYYCEAWLSFAANGVEVTMAFVFQIVTVSSPIPIFNATACLNDIQNLDLFRTCISHICDPETSVSWADKHWVYDRKIIQNITSQTEEKKIINEATKMLLLIQSVHTNQPFQEIFIAIKKWPACFQFIEDCILYNGLICNVSMTLSDSWNILNAAQISHFGIHPNFKALLRHMINI